jgi:L-malate glycosyltransferase
MIHVLHICSGYSNHKLYRELILELSELGIKQTVFVPVRSKKEIGMYSIVNNPNISIHYAFILKKYHRLLFFLKIRMIYRYILKNNLLLDVDIVHAHFLFSDGGVAYRIKARHNIPYLTAMRNTDLNIFYKYFLHLRPFAKKVLEAASAVVFISPAYRKSFYKIAGSIFENKSYIIPNGIKQDWITNENIVKNNAVPLRLLYVGDFSKNKNIPLVMEFVDRLCSEISCTLTLVGGGGNGHEQVIKKLVPFENSVFNYRGRINNENQLRQVYAEHDVLVLLSFFETFGLVCIEALSQGLPIIHTKDQGIDGYFPDENFAFPCNPKSYEDFKKAILSITNNYEKKSQKAKVASKRFKWIQIASEYNNIYQFIK